MFNVVKKQQHTNVGFTLVEMLVSLALFTVVLTMSVGTLLVLIDANSKAQNMQLVMSNLTFALDSMTREIRTGTDWYCGQSGSIPNIPNDDVDQNNATSDCGLSGNNGNYISLMEVGGSLTGDHMSSRITYYYDENYYPDGQGALLRAIGGNSEVSVSDWVPMTGPEIDIQFLELSVSGTTRYIHGGDFVQPTLTMYIRGTAGIDTAAKEFSLQTSVTQRSLDL